MELKDYQLHRNREVISLSRVDGDRLRSETDIHIYSDNQTCVYIQFMTEWLTVRRAGVNVNTRRGRCQYKVCLTASSSQANNFSRETEQCVVNKKLYYYYYCVIVVYSSAVLAVACQDSALINPFCSSPLTMQLIRQASVPLSYLCIYAYNADDIVCILAICLIRTTFIP